MTRAGLTGMRSAYGFVIRAVAVERPTIKKLAKLLDVSKQAASKLAEEMVRNDFIRRAADPDDRRSVRLELTSKGRKVLRRALATSARMENELKRRAGKRDVDTMRRVLMEFLRQNGGVEDVLARRAKFLWP